MNRENLKQSLLAFKKKRVAKRNIVQLANISNNEEDSNKETKYLIFLIVYSFIIFTSHSR